MSLLRPPFRYSGNKIRELPHIKWPKHKRIVELYLGSGAASINSTKPALAFEINSDLFALWRWLQTKASVNRLNKLHSLVEKHKHEKTDVTTLALSKGAETYLRINCCSAMVGQLSSKKLYPQHSLPIKNTINVLDRLKQIKIINADCKVYPRKYMKDGDVVFVDPPYLGTKANYHDKSNNKDLTFEYQAKHTLNLLGKIRGKCPIIFTYGSNAPEVFPDFDWLLLHQRKVPNLRKGGTVTRNEYVTYL